MKNNLEKADTQFSVLRVHCPEERSKAKVVENYHYTSALMVERLKLFFAQLHLWISSVSTEQSQLCVRNTKLAMWERRDLYGQDNLTHCLRQQVLWWKHLHFRPMILRKKIYCKSTKNDWTSCHNKIVWLNFYWCRIPDNGWRRTVLHDKRHWRILTIYRVSGLSWVHFAKRWKIIWPERLNSRKHQNWARIGSHNKLPTK